jgi:2-dehydropantoate 2-reductase
MRLLIVGAGATGGYFGARLAHAGRDVTFLVRPNRAEKLRRTGLQVVSPHGDLTIQPQLMTADAINTYFDIVLLTVKSFQLDAALTDLRPAIGPETMILPVLNGMRHMDILTEQFSSDNVLGCALTIATTQDESGRIIQLTSLQDLSYGELGGQMTPRILALHAFMQGAGFTPRLSTEILLEMWQKWTLLASIGAINCLMRGNIGEVEAAPGGATFALDILGEVTSVIGAAGKAPSEAFLVAARGQITAKGSSLTSSMYRDLQRGLPVEAESIVGDLVRLGQKAQIATPLLATAYTHLNVYQGKVLNER